MVIYVNRLVLNVSKTNFMLFQAFNKPIKENITLKITILLFNQSINQKKKQLNKNKYKPSNTETYFNIN